MPVNEDQFDVEFSQAIGAHLLLATHDYISVYAEPGGGDKTRSLLHQEPVNYPQGVGAKEREKFFHTRINEVAKKVADGKITVKKATLVDDEKDDGGKA